MEAAIEGSAFTPVFCEECYKLGASNVVVHYLDQANLKVASLYRSKEDVEKVEKILGIIETRKKQENTLESVQRKTNEQHFTVNNNLKINI